MISSFIRDGRSIEDMLGVEDNRFKTEWSPSNIQITLENIESICNVLNKKYHEDCEGFFDRYGARK